MPIELTHRIKVLDQSTFAAIAYEVVDRSFSIHDRTGRLFDEDVYQNGLLHALGSRAKTEVWIDVRHQEFVKRYRMDLLVDDGALFELKVAECLNDQHRSQLLNYLMLTGLRHGKLINFRPLQVEHEFVNCHVSLETRRAFQVRTRNWSTASGECQRFQQLLLELLKDWGTGLELALYEEAVTHFLGGPEEVHREVDVTTDGCVLGRCTVRSISAEAVFWLTAMSRNLEDFESHARRFLRHTGLRQIAWANITLKEVTFCVITTATAG